MVETVVQVEDKQTDVEDSSGPVIIRTSNDDSGFEVPQSGEEEPGIYTLGGVVTTTSDSHSANSVTSAGVFERVSTVRQIRQQRRELREERRAERVRERNDRNLLAVVNDGDHTQPTTTTPKADTPAPADNAGNSLGSEIEPAVTQSFKQKHGGRRSGGR
jgi:hypothetical protein